MFKFPILNIDPMDVTADRIINREKYMMEKACMTDWEKTQAICQSARAEMYARSEALWLQKPIVTLSPWVTTRCGGYPIILSRSVAEMFGFDIDE